ncbi:DEAD/DEAH box helicase [Microaerobacter geothermalis]|nr:DEAD/DEAH box helicase [Microaerobacter geothermalis]
MAESEHVLYSEAREFLLQFSELLKSPQGLHTYRVTPLTLWNSASIGWTFDLLMSRLESYCKFPVPSHIEAQWKEWLERYGKIVLEKDGGTLRLRFKDEKLEEKIIGHQEIIPYINKKNGKWRVAPRDRGLLKQKLLGAGFPVYDLAGYDDGKPLPVFLRDKLNGVPLVLRPYQVKAIDTFYREGNANGGNGVIVLPCGAGKTVIGLGIMEKCQCETLILTNNTTSVLQWKREIIEKTSLAEDQIGIYVGTWKEVKPVTISTYQMLTYRQTGTTRFPHFSLFNRRRWGLVIYDEVHLLPAPIFRVTAEIQATRRLGLTAALVREDGCEEDVFGLVGPKIYDIPWRKLEKEGWIAKAVCYEIRMDLGEKEREKYLSASPKHQYRIAAENPGKMEVIRRLLKKHQGEKILVIGQYIHQLKTISAMTGAPLITGETSQLVRESQYNKFNRGEISVLIVSKVANFAVDLPDASIAIQVSGSFGSRQEEAQRLGRLLRPKTDDRTSHFYSLVTKQTKDEEFALRRHRFLTEQGYQYIIMDEKDEKVGFLS